MAAAPAGAGAEDGAITNAEKQQRHREVTQRGKDDGTLAAAVLSLEMDAFEIQVIAALGTLPGHFLELGAAIDVANATRKCALDPFARRGGEYLGTGVQHRILRQPNPLPFGDRDQIEKIGRKRIEDVRSVAQQKRQVLCRRGMNRQVALLDEQVQS